jgi:hypothetical protein
MIKIMRLSSGQHLLLHEGWMADTALRRQLSDPNETGKRLLPRYGPDGFALLMAAYANGIPGGFFVVASIVAGSWHSLNGVSHWLLGAGLVLVAVGFIRCFQCVRVARRFRRLQPPGGLDPSESQTRQAPERRAP